MKTLIKYILFFISLQVWGQKEIDWIINVQNGQLKGRLLLADSTQPGAVVLIIPGSGSTDHNGNNPMARNNSLKMLADSLATHHISSLRIDKRGIGQSHFKNLKESDIRFDDFINDAVLWIKKLKKDKSFSKVIIAGHSQGALVGLLAACKTTPDAYISISGAGYPIGEILKRQMSELVPAEKKQAYQIIDSLQTGKKVSNISGMLYMVFRPSVQSFLISWMKSDPAKILADCNIPTLIIQGDTDLQLDIDNAQRLKKSQPKASLVIIKGMNHVLKPAPKNRIVNLKTYNQPKQPLHSLLIPVIVKFIKTLD